LYGDDQREDRRGARAATAPSPEPPAPSAVRRPSGRASCTLRRPPRPQRPREAPSVTLTLGFFSEGPGRPGSCTFREAGSCPSGLGTPGVRTPLGSPSWLGLTSNDLLQAPARSRSPALHRRSLSRPAVSARGLDRGAASE